MSVEKKYLKSKPVCKVKFVLPEELAEQSKQAYLAGEFNGWKFEDAKLRKQKNGAYATTLDLETGNEYQYKFVLDGERWENDYTADKYAPSGLGAIENSVVVV
ncbi:isoamylase early set domain-containing protein [Saccharophagus degradans]|uniref:Glycoside hydrolase, family 13-like protein n=2 Tax=Saccharophagus degradans TaxID=86304 RepID=Q21K38_SACD2|nr:isoamylase early set domain-containing protein [Saccharophagus degradans]ABD80941.1 glycoside hydrolase, family 13-like protein [Saccharophagus degradans 2-40]MBU2984093.1 isoamylase early set domain-containing protein [Saccharophagus degradans]MDO6424249.1 isoamylase early set domain-containing protein [Saccharophagus degradans]MDO6608296.1 isoamylase early set domain-containing protein [Saccharophagus degradans]WGO96824.1 isoamylase early set domain-containing protein [Saccharophagus degr